MALPAPSDGGALARQSPFPRAKQLFAHAEKSF